MPRRQGHGHPADGAGADAVPLAGDARGGGLAQAPRLVDRAVLPRHALSGDGAGGEREHDEPRGCATRSSPRRRLTGPERTVPGLATSRIGAPIGAMPPIIRDIPMSTRVTVTRDPGRSAGAWHDNGAAMPTPVVDPERMPPMAPPIGEVATGADPHPASTRPAAASATQPPGERWVGRPLVTPRG